MEVDEAKIKAQFMRSRYRLIRFADDHPKTMLVLVLVVSAVAVFGLLT